MWKRNSESPKPETMFVPDPPVSAPPPPRVTAPVGSMIGESIRITGDIVSREEMVFNGQLQGRFDSDSRLTVGVSGKLAAAVKAREADIAGTLEGNIETSERVVLRKGANLIGDVRTGGITIEDGAYFKGGIDIAGAGKR